MVPSQIRSTLKNSAIDNSADSVIICYPEAVDALDVEKSRSRIPVEWIQEFILEGDFVFHSPFCLAPPLLYGWMYIKMIERDEKITLAYSFVPL